MNNNMDLAVQAETYMPSVDDFGNYVDKVPPSIKRGIICLCGSRKDKVFETSTTFYTHTKTKCHQKWLLQINLNKANYYVENEKNKELIYNQQLIIAKLEKDINNKNITIDILTQQFANYKSNSNNENLLEFD